MNYSDIPPAPGQDPSPSETALRKGFGSRIENFLVTVALGAMVLVPLVEAVLRKAFQTTLPGSLILVPHFTLLVGMIGGIIAARENRLLSLSSALLWLQGKAK